MRGQVVADGIRHGRTGHKQQTRHRWSWGWVISFIRYGVSGARTSQVAQFPAGPAGSGPNRGRSRLPKLVQRGAVLEGRGQNSARAARGGATGYRAAPAGGRPGSTGRWMVRNARKPVPRSGCGAGPRKRRPRVSSGFSGGGVGCELGARPARQAGAGPGSARRDRARGHGAEVTVCPAKPSGQAGGAVRAGPLGDSGPRAGARKNM